MSTLQALTLLSMSLHAGADDLVGRAADAALTESERMDAFETAVAASGDGSDLTMMALDQARPARERWVATRVLGQVGSPAAVEALLQLLQDDVSGLRAAGAAALADTGRTEHAGRIAALLEDPAIIVRAAAADALGRLRAPSAVPYLGRALTDPSNRYRGSSLWVRRHYVEALGMVGHSSATPFLVTSLDDADPDVVTAAIPALERVTGVSFADGRSVEEQKRAWKRWWSAREGQR